MWNNDFWIIFADKFQLLEMRSQRSCSAWKWTSLGLNCPNRAFVTSQRVWHLLEFSSSCFPGGFGVGSHPGALDASMGENLSQDLCMVFYIFNFLFFFFLFWGNYLEIQRFSSVLFQAGLGLNWILVVLVFQPCRAGGSPAFLPLFIFLKKFLPCFFYS